MPKNRVIYACEALFVGPSPATGQHLAIGYTAESYSGGGLGSSGTVATGNNLVRQLYRVQSVNHDFAITRRDVFQLGELAAIDRVILEQPTVNLSFDYIQASLTNEKAMGFTISSGNLVSAISGLLNKTTDEKNYFIKTQSEGVDSVGNATDFPYFVTALGNGFITSYTSEAAVGDFPRASVSVEALNVNYDTQTGEAGALPFYATNDIPAVLPSDGSVISTYKYKLPQTQSSTGLGYSAIRPGDITLSIGYDEGGVKVSDAKIQSYSLNVDLSRTPLLKLGSKYAFSREVNFPVNASLSVTMNHGDISTGKLSEILANNTDYNLEVRMNQPVAGSPRALTYLIRGANLDSQSSSTSIGSDKSATLNFSVSIGGPSQSTHGFYMSGINN